VMAVPLRTASVFVLRLDLLLRNGRLRADFALALGEQVERRLPLTGLVLEAALDRLFTPSGCKAVQRAYSQHSVVQYFIATQGPR
jgi:hypothetical protein